MQKSGNYDADGLLSIQTTSICDYEIHHYNMNIRGNPSEIRLTTLPSISKNGSKFSGTEVSFSVSECIEILLREIKHFFQKMLVLKIPFVQNVTADLVVEGGDFPGSRYETVFLASECNVSHFQSSYLECLKSGLEDYVLKHGNSVNTKCDSCFPCRENLKVGSGTAYHREGHKNAGLAMEAVIIINDFPTNPCCRSCSAITEVLYFEDFLPSSIPQSSLNALTSIGWKSYGLTLVSAMDQGGCALLEWGGNVSSYGQINVALHCYHRQLMIPGGHKIQSDQNLMKRAIKLALDDLKEKHEGTLLSENALKIFSSVPNLAKTLTGLIMSSNHSDFRGECLSLLGLQSPEVRREVVEDCIKEKIISVIAKNDRKPQRCPEVAPSLFEEDCTKEMYYEYEEDEGELMDDSQDLEM